MGNFFAMISGICLPNRCRAQRSRAVRLTKRAPEPYIFLMGVGGSESVRAANR
jgi:hypothetical protein